jgi:hypothetical protein
LPGELRLIRRCADGIGVEAVRFPGQIADIPNAPGKPGG